VKQRVGAGVSMQAYVSTAPGDLLETHKHLTYKHL
jgi:hypothetical protein